MRAGSLRDRVRIERRADVDDGAGNKKNGWVEHLSAVSAQIKSSYTRGGSEHLGGGQIASPQSYEIRMRSSVAARSITTAHRVVNVRSGETYNIHAVVNPDRRNREILLYCEAGVADA